MNLNSLLQAEVFPGLFPCQNLFFRKAVTPKLLQLEVVDGDRVRPFFLASIVSQEEKPAWQSFQDLLDHSVKMAQAGMRGIYGLEVLTLDIQKGMRLFHAGDFSKLLINHSKNPEPGFKTLIQFGRLFCVLHHRAPADWGRVDIQTHVEIINPEKVRPENYIKKMIRLTTAGGVPSQGGESGGLSESLYWIQDLGAKPVWEGRSFSQEVGALVYYCHAGTNVAKAFLRPSQ